MAVSNAQISVGTTATALNTASTSGQRLWILNGATAVALGDSAVTTANGYTLAISGTLAVSLAPGEVLYGRVGTGTSTVQVLRSGS